MPIFLKVFFKYFWLLSIGMGFINYFAFKKRLSKNIADESRQEISSLLRSILVVLTVPFGLIGILQMLGKFESFFFVFSRNYNNIYVVLSWLVMIFFWIITLRWVFCKDGARMLLKHKDIFGANFPINETLIKIQLVIMIIGGLAALTIGISIDLYSHTHWITN